MSDTEALPDEAPPKVSSKPSCASLSLGQRALLLFLIFIFWIFLHSDLFLDSVAGLWTGASDANGLTDKGVYITALINVLFTVLAYAMVSNGLL